jgi:hypothetical protein
MVLGNRTMGIGLFRRSINSKGKKIIYTTPALPALTMVSNIRGNYIVNNFVDSDYYNIYDVEEYPEFWIPDTKYLKVVTSVKDDSLYITVINRHPREAIKTTINLDTAIRSDFGIIYELTSEHYLDYNSPDEPNKIKVVERDLHINHTENSFVYMFPKHSVTVLVIHIDSVNAVITQCEDIVLYPNPVDGNSFYITFGTFQMTNRVDIFNSIGQLVYSRPINFYSSKIFIDNLNLPIGAYQVVVDREQERIFKNLIVK